MKITVISTGPTIGHNVATQAEHCGYLFDPDTMQYEAMQNPATATSGPTTGRLFAQLLSQNSVQALLVGNCGFAILKELSNSGVGILVGITGTVRNAIEQVKRSYYSAISPKNYL